MTDAALLRRLYPRVLARTLAVTRSLPDAEDAVQDAVLRALRTWPERGTPETPEAWLVTVAANAYRDRARRARREAPEEDALEQLAQMSPWVTAAMAAPDVAMGWKDELLRLLFACAHPVLEDGEGAALALATVIGLSTREIAAAFAVPPRSMEQRLTRARERLRAGGDVDGVAPTAARERIAAVLTALHLLYNEGYWASEGPSPIRGELCTLALGLARSLAAVFPDAPEVLGLVALLGLHEARRGARLKDGAPVPLPEQDRSLWDRAAITEATALLARALAGGAPGRFAIEAAIAVLHCRAERAEDTDWPQIAELYALLEAAWPTPAVRVNRAFAVARARGAAEGLALLDAHEAARAHAYAPLVRGALLAELGRRGEARAELSRAAASARNDAERAQIEAKLAELGAEHGR